MTGLEERIAYSFKNKELLQTALTHSSYAKEAKCELQCNERLEFLGDAFFDAIIGEALFEMFPNENEGFLSKARASLVCEQSLVQKAREIDLSDMLMLGHGEKKNGGMKRDSLLADAMEAVIGAVFLDGAYDEVKKMTLNLFADELKKASQREFCIKDYKTHLQEILQGEGYNIEAVRYIDVGESGPDHDKVFKVRLEIAGKIISEKEGKSKRKAQQACACEAIKLRNEIV